MHCQKVSPNNTDPDDRAQSKSLSARLADLSNQKLVETALSSSMAGYMPILDGGCDVTELNEVGPAVFEGPSKGSTACNSLGKKLSPSSRTPSDFSASISATESNSNTNNTVAVENTIFSDRLDNLAKEREYLTNSLNQIHSSNKALHDELKKLGYIRAATGLKQENATAETDESCSSKKSTKGKSSSKHATNEEVSPIYEAVSMKKLQQGIPSASLKQTQQSRQHNVTPASSSQESLTLVGDAIPDSTKATVFSSSGSSASGGKGDEDTDSDSHLYGAVGPHTEPCLRQKSADARGDLNLIISPRKSVSKKIDITRSEITIQAVKEAQQIPKEDAATNTNNALWERKNRKKIWSTAIEEQTKVAPNQFNRKAQNPKVRLNMSSCTRACRHGSTEDQINHLKYINHIKTCQIERLECNNAELRRDKKDSSRLQHRLSALRGKLAWRDKRTECLSQAVDVLEKEYYNVLTKMDEIQRMLGLEKILSEQECSIISRFVVRSHIHTKSLLQKVFGAEGEGGEIHNENKTFNKQNSNSKNTSAGLAGIEEESFQDFGQQDNGLSLVLEGDKITKARTYPLPTTTSRHAASHPDTLKQRPQQKPEANKTKKKHRRSRKRRDEVPATDEEITDLPSRWETYGDRAFMK